ncbi:MAG: DUF177 domain-containing protein [Actinobacteria bacterium]|nr:DUF177 domain-containing protein [Actinomycetota bacterium]
MENLIIDIADIVGCIGSSKEINLSVRIPSFETTKGKKDFAEPVRINFIVENVKSGILVKGWVEGCLLSNCDRCLKEFKQPLKVDVEEVYYFSEALSEDREVDEDEIFKVVNNKINLESLIRQAFVLNIPIKLLCNEECKGLCPICGVNLNEKNCGCKKDRIDPRLVKLKELLKE